MKGAQGQIEKKAATEHVQNVTISPSAETWAQGRGYIWMLTKVVSPLIFGDKYIIIQSI